MNIPLILPIDVVDVAGAKIREDHGAAVLIVQTDTGDRVAMGMSPLVVDAMLESLMTIRKELTMHQVEQTISFKPVHSAAVSEQVIEGRRFVCLTFDRSLPSAQAFLMPAKNARVVAKALGKTAREVSGALADPSVS